MRQPVKGDVTSVDTSTADVLLYLNISAIPGAALGLVVLTRFSAIFCSGSSCTLADAC